MSNKKVSLKKFVRGGEVLVFVYKTNTFNHLSLNLFVYILLLSTVIWPFNSCFYTCRSFGHYVTSVQTPKNYKAIKIKWPPLIQTKTQPMYSSEIFGVPSLQGNHKISACLSVYQWTSNVQGLHCEIG